MMGLVLGADFTRMRDFTWRVSDCEELVGFTASLHLQTLQ